MNARAETATARPTPGAALGQAARLLAGAGTAALAAYGAVRLGAALPHHPQHVAAVPDWLLSTRIDNVAIHAAWLIAVGLAGYLAAIQALAAAGHLARSASLVALTERASGGLTRRICAGALSAGLAGATVGALPAAAQLPDGGPAAPVVSDTGADPGPPEMRVLVEDTSTTVPTTAPALTTAATAAAPVAGLALPLPAPTMRLLTEASPLPALDNATAALPASPNVWLVRPGDNLWDIAEAVLTQDDGTRAEIDDVQRYWERLIDANRHNLADPANPDLLFSGQQIALPQP